MKQGLLINACNELSLVVTKLRRGYRQEQIFSLKSFQVKRFQS